MFMRISDQNKQPNAIWSLFRSVRLTIVILIILAVVSIMGTLIPQMSHLYHSLWFRCIIGFLAVNLVICSIDRFSVTWKLIHTVPRPDRSKPFEQLPHRQTFTVSGKIEDASVRIRQFLKGHYKKIHEKNAPDKYFFYAEKGGYSRFGVYLVHSSVLVILTGALIGSFFGFEAFVNLMEGQRTDTVLLQKDGALKPLGFEVRCDKFAVDFYENGAPEEYRSDLTFLVDGREVEKKSVLVNHPAQFMGVTFYQSNYGTIPGRKVRLSISKDGEQQKAYALEVEPEKPMQLPGNEGQFFVVDVKGDFMNTGPAVLIEIRSRDGDEKRFWVFRDYERIRRRLPGPMLQSPRFDPSAFKPYTFFLTRLETGYYTGLQVNRDPGVPLVWIGCFLIIAGFFVTFFTQHIRIWIRLSKQSQEVNISVAGVSNRNPVGLERELLHLTNDLKKLFGGKG